MKINDDPVNQTVYNIGVHKQRHIAPINNKKYLSSPSPIKQEITTVKDRI